MCARNRDVFIAIGCNAITRDSVFMRVSCNPQFKLGLDLGGLLPLSGLRPIVPAIAARVLPGRFGAY